MAGAMRQVRALQKGLKHRYGEPPHDQWGGHIEGAGAELAVAKAVNRYWAGFYHHDPEKFAGDIGEIEVRWTWRMDGRLIVHDRDKDESPFVLVRGSFPEYDVVGWIYGKNAKQSRYLYNGDGRPAYFVPATDLWDMTTLEGKGGKQSGKADGTD